MGLLSRLLGRETRSSPSLPVATPAPGIRSSDPFLADYFGLGRAGARYASPDEAVAALAVASRCVSLIAEALASLPLRVYRYTEDGGRELAPTHPLDSLLNSVANDRASAFTVREGLVRDVAMRGNGYLHQVVDGRGRVAELRYLPWRYVSVERLASKRLRYRVTEPDGGTTILLEDEVVHLRYATRDGIMGVGPLEWAGIAVGLAVAQSELAQEQVDRGFTPDLSFETATAFSSEEAGNIAFNRLKRQLSERTAKLRGKGTPLLLESGLTAKPLASSGREAQFHESRITGLEDIARIYGVPLSVVGLGRNASYGSLSEESRALVQNCLAPWARRVETEIMRAALTADGRRRFVIEHDLTGLLRGDQAARFTAYGTGIQWGFLSPNDARRAEGWNSRPGGDEYLTPVNMRQGNRPAPGDQQPPAAA